MHDVVAIGGNGAPRGTLAPLHRYLLELTGERRPKVCFIPTASGDAADGIDAFYSAFSPAAEATHLELFAHTTPNVGELLAAQNLIYVGGGNTRNLLLLWKAWGVDEAIRAAWDRGAVLAGPSAGGLCWFEAGITDSYPRQFRELACLGWVPGSFCPHYDSEPGRQPVVERLVASGVLPAGYAVEDDAAVHVRDGSLLAALTQAAGKTAYAVRSEDGRFVREPLAMRSLAG